MMQILEVLKQCYQKREEYILKNQLEAYRLLNLEESEWPIVIDIYKDNAIIHAFSYMEMNDLQELEKCLKELLSIQDFFYKNRTKQDFELPKTAPKQIVVQEYGNSFSINLADYLDCGLFLDHRETRKWISSKSKNKIVLNTFAYTGSFSIYAANAGAEKTYSVDLSRTYTDWIKENMKLNNLPPEKNWVYKMDTFEFFRYAKRKQLIFDIIIIDPPTFSKNKGEHFSVQKDHAKLINQALEILAPDGFILFSNNCKSFHFDYKNVPSANISEKPDTIPPDFAGTNPHYCAIITKK